MLLLEVTVVVFYLMYESILSFYRIEIFIYVVLRSLQGHLQSAGHSVSDTKSLSASVAKAWHHHHHHIRLLMVDKRSHTIQ